MSNTFDTRTDSTYHIENEIVTGALACSDVGFLRNCKNDPGAAASEIERFYRESDDPEFDGFRNYDGSKLSVYKYAKRYFDRLVAEP